MSLSGIPSGSFTLADNVMNAASDLMVAGVNFYAGGTAAGDPAPHVYVEPSKDVPYVVVRDQIILAIDVTTAMSTTSRVGVRLECAQVSLDQSTLNQLLRTQTV